MAVVETDQHEPRRVLVEQHDDDPQTVLGFVWRLTGSLKRALIFLMLFGFVVLVPCMVLRGEGHVIVHAAHQVLKWLSTLRFNHAGQLELPFSTLAGSGITYLTIRARQRNASRSRDPTADDTGAKPSSVKRSRRRGRRELTR